MKKTILIAAIVGFVFAAHARLYALESTVDIGALKEQIKNELRNERPWQEDISSFKVDVHGFVSQGFLTSGTYNYLVNDSRGGSFQFNEIGINFGKDLTDKLRIGVQFLARDVGDRFNDEPKIDWAYGDYRWQDWLGLRAGVLKIPNGLYNETRDIDMLRTCILLPSGVYNETFREMYNALSGIGLYGDVPLGPAGSLGYQLLVGTQNLDADNNGAALMIEDDMNEDVTPGMGLGGLDLYGIDLDDMQMKEAYIASLQWCSPWGLRLQGVINYSHFKNTGTTLSDDVTDSTTHQYDMELDIYNCRTYTLSAEYTWENLILAAEYWSLRYSGKFSFTAIPIGAPAAAAVSSSADSIFEKEGGYIGASYRVNEWFEIGTHYNVFFPDAKDHDGEGQHFYANAHEAWTKEYVLSTRFDINQYWTCKMEGHKISGKGDVLSSYNDNWSDPEDDFWVYLAKITFSF